VTRFLAICGLSVALAAFLLAGCGGALAQSRVALIIGNGAYLDAPQLANTVKGADAVAQAFERLDFTTITVSDAAYNDFRGAIRKFNELTRTADFAVVYFAGYGMELRGENWLLPTDAELLSELDVASETIGLNTLMQSVGRATSLGLIILDASRSNPGLARMQRTSQWRAVTRGLARVEPAQNVVVAYAAKDGTVAEDVVAGLYTAALLKYLETPRLDINLMFRKVRDDVMAQTNRRQQPFVYGSLPSKPIYLKESSVTVLEVKPKPDQVSADETIWQTIRESHDSSLLSEFLTKFPASPHLAEARTRLSALAQLPHAVASTPAAPDAARKAPDDADTIEECDRLAASPLDSDRLKKIAGVELSRIDVAAAEPACADAMRRRPETARFPFQAGRVALARNDYAAALDFYEKASALGSALAMYGLGAIYAEGKIVDQDYGAARRWYEKAVALNCAFAMADLAALYENGRGGPRNPAKALDLYRQAAEAGDRTSMTRIGNFYESGIAIRQDFAQALRWYRKSAELGDEAAMKQLGKLYDGGHGVPKSSAEARKWYERAKRQAEGR
jgi:hypothetical protein